MVNGQESLLRLKNWGIQEPAATQFCPKKQQVESVIYEIMPCGRIARCSWASASASSAAFM